MTDTPRLALPLIDGAQAQKHVTHNEALLLLDALVQIAVLDRDLTAAPASPGDGERWLVAADATGAWAGHDQAVAAWQDGHWLFCMPQPGWLAYVLDEGALVAWTGSAWVDAVAAPGALHNLTRLGIGTTADAGNPFAAKLNKALWTAKYVGEGGDGDLRYTLNKEAPAQVLSLLMQSDWSGRAEIGLMGDDDFRFKVSPDGSAWHDAIVIDRVTGRPRFPSGGVRDVLQANRIYYVAPGGSNANSGLSAGAPLQTIAAAVAKTYQVDSNGYNVTIQLADGTYATGGVPVHVERPLVGGGRLEILGNPVTPANVIVRGTYPTVRITTGAIVALRHLQIESSGTGSLIHADARAHVFIDNLNFAATSRSQIECASGAAVTVLGDCVISGGAALSHILLGTCGVIDGPNRTITLNGALSFGQFVLANNGGVYALWNATWNVTGTITGKRYTAELNGVINTFGKGANHFPGNVAGTTATGGQYA